jgi:transcriptional regulator with XRE-family HTH domain
MKIGEEVAKARKRKGLTQEQLAMELPMSRELIAKCEKGNRKLQPDMRKHVAEGLDDPEYYFMTWNEATGYVSIPYLNGDYIDQHPSSMKHLVKKEANEALDRLGKVCWVKPVSIRSSREREEMKQVVHELLDAVTSMINLVAVICREYNFSMKEIFLAWRVTVRAKGWNK